MRKKEYPPSIPYEEFLYSDLRDNPNRAVEYLNACLEDIQHPEVFLLALRDVISAWGFREVADETGLNRENLFRMLSEKGNPRLSSLITLLDAVGLRLAIVPARKQERKKKQPRIA